MAWVVSLLSLLFSSPSFFISSPPLFTGLSSSPLLLRIFCSHPSLPLSISLPPLSLSLIPPPHSSSHLIPSPLPSPPLPSPSFLLSSYPLSPSLPSPSSLSLSPFPLSLSLPSPVVSPSGSIIPSNQYRVIRCMGKYSSTLLVSHIVYIVGKLHGPSSVYPKCCDKKWELFLCQSVTYIAKVVC